MRKVRNTMRPITSLVILGVMGATQQRSVTGFTVVARGRTNTPTSRSPNAATRMVYDYDDESSPPNSFVNINEKFQWNGLRVDVTKAIIVSTLALLFVVSPCVASTDFAGQNVSGRDFSGQELSGKDFSTVTAQGTNFRKANLQGANFQAAKLEKADFTGANLQDAKFEDAVLDGTIMKDVLAQRASFSKTILDIADLENADLSQSLWPSKYRIMICDMAEIKGINPVTGVDSRGSVMCNSELRYSN